jgi:hypothetical protein
MTKTGRYLTWVLLGLAMLAVISAKAYRDGWLSPQPTLQPGNPGLVFFNGSRGCECELYVYANADRQVANWSEAQRGGLPFIWLSIHAPGELKNKYKVIRAPTLLLVDATGNVVMRQDNVVSDEEPLDLAAFEKEISLLVGQTSPSAQFEQD